MDFSGSDRAWKGRPAIVELILVALCAVRILLDRFAVVGDGFRIGIEPVFAGQIFHPPVTSTAMVEDHVHDHFDPFFLGRNSQLTVILIAAVTAVDTVEVGCGVTW